MGCSILDFFSPQKRKKKRIRAFAKLQLKLWLNKNWTQLTTVTRIGFFQPGKEVNSNWKKYETFFFLSFLNQREGEKKTFTFFLLFQTNKKKKQSIYKNCESHPLWSLLIFFFLKKGKRFKTERGGSCANWDLVDSASSHMLVSRTKPCMPQNNCIAGICAWLITSDVICRNSFAVSALLDNLAKRQANTWTSANLLGVLLRMNEIKTNAADAAATQQCWLNSFRAKAGLPASFDEQLPYQLVLAV